MPSLRSALSDICKHSPELAQTVVDAGWDNWPGEVGDDGFESQGDIDPHWKC